MSAHDKNITEVFQDEVHEQCEHCQSIFSPGAYLIKLLETIDKYIKPEGVLRKRRPDLYELKLDCDNTLKEKLYLEIVNEIMLSRLDAGKRENEKLGPWLKGFATRDDLPFFSRENFPLVAIRAYLKENQTTLEQIYRLFYPGEKILAESLDLSEEGYALLINSSKDFAHLKKVYALKEGNKMIDLIRSLRKRKRFIQHTGIDSDELPELLRAYNKIKKLPRGSELSIDNKSDEIKNLNDTALSFLYRFICLSDVLGWSFDALSYIFLGLGSDEINEDTLKKMVSISSLEKSFSKELKEDYKEFVLEEAWHPSATLLYLSEKLFKEKVTKLLGSKENYDKLASVDIHDIKGSDQMGILQGILGLSADELNTLIDYQKSIYTQKTAVESLLQNFYAQSALARLMGIPIEELLDIISLLDNDKTIVVLSRVENLGHVVALYKEFERYGISGSVVRKLLSANEKIKERYAGPIKELLEAIGKTTLWEESEFLDTLQSYFAINKDLMMSIVAFIEKGTGKSFKKPTDREELLIALIKATEVFGTLEFTGEDIDHISKYDEKVYQCKRGWSLKAIQNLLYYKDLKAAFSANNLSINQYIDWFYSKEYTEKAILEKIPALSSWNKESLGLLKADKDFKGYFTNKVNPIGSLIKIRSFMDLIDLSGLNAKILLGLKSLHGLKSNTEAHWKKYLEAASQLKLLGERSDQREESEKNLQEQKRDLLSKYMIYGSDTLENMRDLYAELLIDVEMSGCSKISPLKAALNSAQLYVHRCSMRLEEGASIDHSLSNQTLELLANYRKWEASQKIQSHPENYLDPTLRKIASPQYKELQNTLMQGNITEEAVSEAYLKYFEDFDQLASLEIIESYFDAVEDPISGGEKNTMFLLGRSIAQPYAYYYCTAVFSSKDQKILYWTPWQKIEASIPVEIVTATYAFDRLFVFWVEKIEKKEATVNESGTNAKYKDLTSFSIRYAFQRVSGKWSEVQTLADNLDIPGQSSELCWKKVAAMQLKDQQQKSAKYMVVSIGDVKKGTAQWFLIDEDLIAKKQTSKLSLENFSYQYQPYHHDLGKVFSSGIKAISLGDEIVFYQNVGNGAVLDIYNVKTDSWDKIDKNIQIEDDIRFEDDILFDVEKEVVSNKEFVLYSAKKIVFISTVLTRNVTQRIDIYNLKASLSSSVDIYNHQTKKWERPQIAKSYAVTPRRGMAVATVGERAIFFGGCDNDGKYLSDIGIYDEKTNTFEKANYTPVARENARSAVIGKKAIFFGGYDGKKVSSAIDIYDDQTKTWKKSNYEGLREHWNTSLAIIAKKVIIFSGFDIGGKALSIHIYDDQTGQWKKESYQPSEARWDATVAVMGKKAIFFGGMKYSSNSKNINGIASSAIDIYDDGAPEGKKWIRSKIEGPLFRYGISLVQGGKAIFVGLDSEHNAHMYTLEPALQNKISHHPLNKKFSPRARLKSLDDDIVFYEDIGKYSFVDIYNIKEGKWSRSERNTLNGGDPRYDVSAAVTHNKNIIFFSGQKHQISSIIEAYDLKTKKWEKTKILKDYCFWPRDSMAATAVGNKAIFFGGWDGNNNYSSEIDIYNAQSNELEYPKNNYKPIPRMNAATAVIGKKAIFFGGFPDKETSSIDIYNEETGGWKKETSYSTEGRQFVSAAVVGRKAIFFAGKKYGPNSSSTIDIYDDQSGKWTKSNYKASEARQTVTVATVDKKAIFFGGENFPSGDPAKTSSAIDIYDDETGKWKNFRASEARRFATVAVIDKKVIFFGGVINRSNEPSTAVDIYDDESGKWTSFKVERPLKSPTVAIKGTKAVFTGLDKENKAHLYVIETGSLYYHLKDKKLLASSIQDHLLYANFFPDTQVNISNKDCSISLLEKYTESASGLYPVRNHLGGYIVRNGLEVFLSLSSPYSGAPIMNTYSIYNNGSISTKLEYSPSNPIEPILNNKTKTNFLRLNMPKGVSVLRQKAYGGGIKRLLTLEAQKFEFPNFSTLKPTSAVIAPDNLSAFSGPYGLYLWEMFFHIPTLVARHLNTNQDFPTAKKWHEYIMDPIKESCEIWRFLPFKAPCDDQKVITCLNNRQSSRDLEIDPFDAYSIAAQRITSFEKYMVISYIDNLLSWGDMLFEGGSWESLNEATMLYIRAWDLLGGKPIKKEKSQLEPKSYNELKGAHRTNLKLLDLEMNLDSNHSEVSNVSSCSEALGMAAYEDYFCTPENEGFVELWDTLQDRLYKIRHCLDIKGKPHMPALFEPALDPKALMQASAAGGSGINIPEISRVPFYRFDYMIGYAKSTVDTVIGLGAEMLSVMEKKDAEALSALYNKQESILANLITPIKEKAIEALKEEHKALSEGLNNANHRKKHYDDLISKGLSGGEKAAVGFSSAAIGLRSASSGIRAGAVAAHLVPTVFGFACGDLNPGASVDSAAGITDALATISDQSAQMASTSASYERRAEEWGLQRDLADYDTKQIQAQIQANLVHQGSAQKDLQAHQKSIEQMKEKKDFFEKKFTREELYAWMKAQIASVYFQGYKLALKMAKQAEKTYQYELNTDEVFITSNGWNSLKEGLLAGHHLKFALEQMHAAYHDKNERRLEISKNISLKQINPYALYQLKEEGECKFAFTEKLFDLDFPGHYSRKIKALKMTIPAVIGPYESIHAGLQQTANKTVLQAEGKGIEAVKFLLGEKGAKDPNDPSVLRGNMSINQQIAISRGHEDSGMFELNFNDERYLPFEGTGAVSNWIFSLPKENNRFDTESISDVIIHLDYTAFDGGNKFKEDVKKLNTLKSYQGVLTLNLIMAYQRQWEKFKHAKDKKKNPFTFKLSGKVFPSYLKEVKVDPTQKAYLIPTLLDAKSSVKIEKLNNETLAKDYALSMKSTADFALGKDWKMQMSGDVNQLKEVILFLPYTAQRL